MKSPFGLGVAALLVASRAGAQVRVRQARGGEGGRVEGLRLRRLHPHHRQLADAHAVGQRRGLAQGRRQRVRARGRGRVRALGRAGLSGGSATLRPPLGGAQRGPPNRQGHERHHRSRRDRPGHADTAENWLVKRSGGRFFAEKNSGFVAARLGADEPAGKTIYGGGQLGYSRQLYKDVTTRSSPRSATT